MGDACDQLPDRRSMLESVAAETIRQKETREAGNTPENGMSVRRCLIASRPRILDRGVGNWREAMDRHFQHFVEE